MPDEELVVDIEAATPEIEVVTEPDKGKEPAKAETKTNGKTEPVEDLRNQLDTLKKQSEQATAKIQSAEQLAQQRGQEVEQVQTELATVKKELVQSNASTVENAILAEKETLLSARKDRVAALQAGDYDKEAEATERGQLAAARLTRLEEAKNEIDVRLKEPDPVRPRTEAPQNGPGPRATAWLAEHPEYVNNRAKNLRAAAAHASAVEAGIEVESDDYFDHVERELGLKTDEPIEAEPSKPRQSARTKSMPAAPVSRDGGGSSSGQLSATQVVLTKGEQDVATDGTHTWQAHDLAAGRIKDKALINQPIGIKEMARRKAELTKQGVYDRN